MGSDREKLSFSELDKRRRENRDRNESRSSRDLSRSHGGAYNQYKSQLNQLFDQGGVPDALKSKFEEAGIQVDTEKLKSLRQKLLDANSPAAIKKALVAYEKSFNFPNDEEVLHKLLEMDQETEILIKSLEALLKAKEDGRLKRASALNQRLKALLMLNDDDDVYDLATELQG